MALTSVIIGDESLLVRCGDQLLERGHQIAAVVTENAENAAWAAGKGLNVVAPGAGLADRLPGTFDWLFSIANLRVIPEAVLSRATAGAVNFHDGPLPRYAGLNAPVWALLNGESRHGVAWHRIEGGIDEGRIYASAEVEIAEGETAFTLNAKCYAAAVDSFGTVLDAVEQGTAPVAQDLSQRSYFAKDDRPEGGGFLDFRKGTADLIRLVRALDHAGYWNPLGAAKLMSDRVLLVGKADGAEGQGEPGTILSADAESLVVATGDGAIRLSDLRELDGRAAGPHGGVAGNRLQAGDFAREGAALRSAASGELHWRRVLSKAAPVALSLGGSGGGSGSVPVPGFEESRLLATLAAVALRSAGEAQGTLALNVAEPEAPEVLAEWLPLNAAGATFGDLTETIATQIEKARRHPSYARDLIARDPVLNPLDTPGFGISLTGQPIPGCAVTAMLNDGTVTLHGDPAQIGTAGLDLLAERIATLGTAVTGPDADATAVADLPFTGAKEQAQQTTWNATAIAYDQACPMHGFVERRADAAPDATALIFEDATLSHAALEAKANQIAHTLRNMGVTEGQPVGLYCRRGFDLVAGALGILKAGGAYVPMDPTYPADRIAHFLTDSGAAVVVTQSAVADTLPEASNATPLSLDTDPRIAAAATTRGDWPAPAPEAMAYMIYTSGSTGKPKGVMVAHQNVANFFKGMDAQIRNAEGDTWMAVTSLSFDIAVLELFHALSRGFRVVIGGDSDRMRVAEGPLATTGKGMDFSLFYWGNDDGPGPKKYELLLEGAKFADQNGFRAVWTPERHFHAFGGPYPNPAVTGAAVAAVTSNIDVRAGSCVAPLHHPARIAEEWAVIDNLTGGRAGIGFASGWQPDDFVLRPENTPPANKPALFTALDQVRRLWRGEEVAFPTAKGTEHAVLTQPRPVSKELPVWVTTAGNPDTWREAGANGANVLTHLLGQSIDEVAGKIRIYHEALRDAGHDPSDFTVTLMLHTFIADSRDEAREIAREPMKDYLRSAAGLIKQYAWAFPAFKKPAGAANPMDIDLGSLSEEELEGILDFAFLRYFEDSGLFGTVEDCAARVEALKAIGVDEVACLIDYGIAPDVVLEGLKPLAQVVARANSGGAVPEGDFSLAAQILRHGVTHMQCTPSMARMIGLSDVARRALGGLKQMLLGGEALPGALVADLQSLSKAQILNMYGPTETTIWSTVAEARPGEDLCNIGHPIANTQVHILDAQGAACPVGVAGELAIGGDGVTLGYWRRAELTAERFVPGPDGSIVYRTGDLVRQRADGALDFMGRLDHQIKLRGYRIELGEIEARLTEIADVSAAVVIPREDRPGDVRLVAYVTGTAPAEADWRAHLAAHLPDYMMPAALVGMDSFPLTPNAKIDRKALPAPSETAMPEAGERPAASGIAGQIAEVFQRLLGVAQVRGGDNFFALGGHSLLAVQAHRDIAELVGPGRLAVTDIFRFPTVDGLAAHLGEGAADTPAANAPSEPRATQAEARRALRRRRMQDAG